MPLCDDGCVPVWFGEVLVKRELLYYHSEGFCGTKEVLMVVFSVFDTSASDRGVMILARC